MRRTLLFAAYLLGPVAARAADAPWIALTGSDAAGVWKSKPAGPVAVRNVRVRPYRTR